MPNQVIKPSEDATRAKNHELYDNEVLAVKLQEILDTYLDAQGLMTIDRSLTEAAGMWKTINVYTYEGQVEELGIGQGNTESGSVKLVPKHHEVKVQQQKFVYQDEEIMRDPRVLEVAIKGMAESMFNHLNRQFFKAITENDEIKFLSEEAQAMSYDLAVDALGELAGVTAANENEQGFFILINHKHRAALRKDADFVQARQGEIVINGQIGSIAGLPVVVSRLVPAGEAYVMSKDAVTCFVKKDAEVEQERDADTRTNKIFGRKVNVVAVTDTTKVIKIKIK